MEMRSSIRLSGDAGIWEVRESGVKQREGGISIVYNAFHSSFVSMILSSNENIRGRDNPTKYADGNRMRTR